MNRLLAMEAFVRVVDAGSFSGAAKLLRIGQPAVSKRIAQLEERLGVRLLLRSTHRLRPTEAGQKFYDRAKRSIEEAEEAELAACGLCRNPVGPLARLRSTHLRPPARDAACRSFSPSIPRLMSTSFSRSTTPTWSKRA
jgi:DNA-binding transcriptional LysR family regulator